MSKIGLFYSSSTGNTEEAAKAIKSEFDKLENDLVSIHYVSRPLTDMLGYDGLILGAPTWDLGELEADWADVFDEMDKLDLSGKRVAVFGLGDQFCYPDSYQNAIGLLAKKARERGAELVGFTTTEGHEFDESLSVEQDQFMGLALDADNQPELSPERIAAWVAQLAREFELSEENA
jgi:flavodoxin I